MDRSPSTEGSATMPERMRAGMRGATHSIRLFLLGCADGYGSLSSLSSRSIVQCNGYKHHHVCMHLGSTAARLLVRATTPWHQLQSRLAIGCAENVLWAPFVLSAASPDLIKLTGLVSAASLREIAAASFAHCCRMEHSFHQEQLTRTLAPTQTQPCECSGRGKNLNHAALCRSSATACQRSASLALRLARASCARRPFLASSLPR